MFTELQFAGGQLEAVTACVGFHAALQTEVISKPETPRFVRKVEIQT